MTKYLSITIKKKEFIVMTKYLSIMIKTEIYCNG